MSRYHRLFERLNSANEGAFVPFVTLGDPTPEQSLKVIDALVAGGADALELGIPFSDPIADGPTIQAATLRARNAGTRTQTCFDMLTQVREKYPELPIGLLVYANLVYAPGVDSFYSRAAAAGVDSVLVADVPLEMAAPFKAAADKAGVESIYIAPPNGDEATLKAVAETGSGYTYLLSRAGVTGTETKAGTPVDTLLATLAKYDAPPSLLGFGISSPEQVRDAIKSGAAGAISGSAVVKIIEQHLDQPQAMLNALTAFVKEMKAATRK
ncbi:tryptophan synthase subunit alpha [Oceanimonas baumannii]|uniref:Tryptophan synthase alpha chain n=1 Tax=Oceanimonas baumannii TaxID=129578 RepID=A0A235CPW3_9GAMM|nr:tryptophan synthase subunit alpha [Oceanimonas baumannii]OYD26037.1 tryptophan synthase subunit alpha [Oceanimonas baumannii]TDW62320.1 tryptophan synthase alpha chain [Oceanimonas baumannii]